MKNKIKTILAILFFIVGFGIFIFPHITDKQYKDEVLKKEKEYISYIEKIQEELPIEENQTVPESEEYINYKSIQELLDILKQRNEYIYKSNQHDFIYNTNYEVNDINLAKYGIKYDIFGYLELPSIGITLPIYLGANNNNMRLGAVHLTGTSYPIGGINTNSVIAAHRGYHRTKMFRDIDKIKIGDIMYIKNFNGTLTYKAVKTSIISSKSIASLTIEEGKDMITIISCHPYPFNYQRYVVYFERV